MPRAAGTDIAAILQCLCWQPVPTQFSLTKVSIFSFSKLPWKQNFETKDVLAAFRVFFDSIFASTTNTYIREKVLRCSAAATFLCDERLSRRRRLPAWERLHLLAAASTAAVWHEFAPPLASFLLLGDMTLFATISSDPAAIA